MNSPHNQIPPSIETKVCRSLASGSRFFGYSVFDDLLGEERLLGLAAIALLGRRSTSEELAVLDDVATVLTGPDPRIWPLKADRLISSFGRYLPGYIAGYLCTYDGVIGQAQVSTAAHMMVDIMEHIGRADLATLNEHEEQLIIKKLEEYRAVPGFGVPFRPHDERLTKLQHAMKSRNWHARPFFRLHEHIIAAMKKKKPNTQPNIAIGAAAACLDAGFGPSTIDPLVMFLMAPNHLASSVEGAAQKPKILQRLPDDCVDYRGPKARKSPRACKITPPGPTEERS